MTETDFVRLRFTVLWAQYSRAPRSVERDMALRWCQLADRRYGWGFGELIQRAMHHPLVFPMSAC